MGETVSLSTGIEVTASYAPTDPRLAGDQAVQQHLVSLRPPAEIDAQPVEITMQQAVYALRRAIRTPGVAGDPAMRDYLQQLKGYRPRPVAPDQASRGRKFDNLRLQPSRGSAQETEPRTEQDDKPVIALFNMPFSITDLQEFSSYIMSQTALEGPDDPRSKFIETLRNEPLVDQQTHTSRRRLGVVALAIAGVAAGILLFPQSHHKPQKAVRQVPRSQEFPLHALPLGSFLHIFSLPIERIKTPPETTTTQSATTPVHPQVHHQPTHKAPKPAPVHHTKNTAPASSSANHTSTHAYIPPAPVRATTPVRSETPAPTYHSSSPNSAASGGSSVGSLGSTSLQKTKTSTSTHSSGGTRETPQPDPAPEKHSGGGSVPTPDAPPVKKKK